VTLVVYGKQQDEPISPPFTIEPTDFPSSTLKKNLRLTLQEIGAEDRIQEENLVKEDYTEDIVRFEHIRPQLLLNQGQNFDQDVNIAHQARSTN
jgi:hypothetical protein